ARARGGGPGFATTTLRGSAALTASYALHVNECAGLKSGTGRVWLDAGTLMPLRLDERRAGAALRRFDLTYSAVNAALPASALAAPALGAQPRRVVHGFVRSSVREAAAKLGYTPLVPHLLPPGYALASAGWARRSQRTGPEGSNPAYPGFFGAVYQRGFEHIDLTERLGTKGSWPSDPFGVECGFMQTTRVTVNGGPGWLGISPDTPPHLYWRKGKLLFTLSGPFPQADLLAIAGSLS
ncbi:MAG: hypothetical protein QOE29_687, partial [Gaiellaceae bacterium]|nr:hypothetical protein [Gaiellaceae bacterium]